MRNMSMFTLTISACLALAGCGGDADIEAGAYKTIADAPNRDTATARLRNAEAVALLHESDLGPAVSKLKEALAADMFFGPAHNNLGTAYYKQKKYYLAAWEFQYAAKLMPNEAKPLTNLGLVFEAVGRNNDAADWYEKALALEPISTDTAGNLARVYIRMNRKDERTRELLALIAMKDTRPKWTSWAREQLAILGQPEKAPLPTSQPVEE